MVYIDQSAVLLWRQNCSCWKSQYYLPPRIFRQRGVTPAEIAFQLLLCSGDLTSDCQTDR